MECDAGWARDPSISVDEADGTGQANFIAGLVVANIGTHRFICTGESGIVCVYARAYWTRTYSYSVGEHTHWIVFVAGTTLVFASSILASTLKRTYYFYLAEVFHF